MEQKTLIAYKQELADGFSVEYEILQPMPSNAAVAGINTRIAEIDNEVAKLNTEIDRLTNHADGFDYTIAVASGILCGLIDSFVIGEFDFERGKANSNRQVNGFITKFAKLNGYKGERLNGAIDFLEKKFPVAQDNIWSGANIGVSAKNHHLADFAHHPTLLGLVAAVIVQFFRCGIFVDKAGEWHFVPVQTDPKELMKIWLPVLISGVLLWLCNIAESEYKDEIDEKIPKPIRKLIKALAAVPAVISVLRVAVNWAGHLVSDLGGSKNTAGGGMGIPGLFVSLLHELSSVPPLNATGLPEVVNDLYVKEKFDMRAELAVLNELGRQAIPVLIGEVLVRGFYFVRHLVQEYQAHGNFEDVNWQAVIPFNNRTIARMMTIESGTFTAVDLADAAIRSAMKNGLPTNPLFWKDFILRVNFVGIGRFAIAIGVDVEMGMKKSSLENKRIALLFEQTELLNARVFYYQADMWIQIENSERAVDELLIEAEQSIIFMNAAYDDMSQRVENISKLLPKAEEKNPGLIKELRDCMW